MRFAELVREVAEASGFTQGDAEIIVRQLFEIMGKSLKDGEDVMVPNFGKFTVTTSAPRTARNPRTGEQVQVPERKRPKFRASRALNELVDGS
jgi:DNA-binding protein HU-beta